MARKSIKSTKAKVDTYKEVTDAIIAQMESGVMPWRRPWSSMNFSGSVARPQRHNGERYQGINILMLWIAAEFKGYESPHWLTFKQAKELGGNVLKGEKSSRVVYYSTFKKTEDMTNVKTGETESVDVKIPFLKTYCVFNSQQCENLPERYQGTPAESHQWERNEQAETFFAQLSADLRHGGSSAYYSPGLDYVQMPEPERFPSAAEYLSTLAHEFIHWTRHTSRINRTFNQKRFGDDGYAMEELVAELGSAFLCADLGIEIGEPREDHAAYLKSWLDVLKADKRAIFTAASYASKAVEFLHGLQPATETIETADHAHA